jgi:hypothetical protein
MGQHSLGVDASIGGDKYLHGFSSLGDSRSSSD